MKKLYALILITALSGNLMAQKIFEGSISDSWALNTNWSDDILPVATDEITLEKMISELDTDISAERLFTDTTAGDYTLNVANDATLHLKIDVANTSYWNAENVAVDNIITGTSSLTFFNDFYIENDLYVPDKTFKGSLAFKNFKTDATLNFESTCSVLFDCVMVINNKGIVNMKGDFVSTELVSPGTPDWRFTFSQVGNYNILGNATISANEIYMNTGTNVIISTNASHVVTDDLLVSSGQNGINNLTINTADCIESTLKVANLNTLNLNVNANLSNMGPLNMKSTSCVLNLTIDNAVTAINFDESDNLTFDAGAVVNITGFKENVLRFGTDTNGLTTTQLSQFVADGAGLGKSLELDAQGYLIVAATASNSHTENIDVRLKSNVVKEELEIVGDAFIEQVEVFDLSGNLILSNLSNEKTVNVSQLSTGVYIAKIKTSNKVFSMKFVKK